MKVLITGATGFVGSWMTRRLVQDGHNVKALVRNPNTASDIKGLDVELVPGDVTDLQSIEKNLSGVEVVFHLAGVVGYSKAARQQMDQVNVQGTANVLAAMQRKNCARLVYMSSVVAVGAGRSPQEILDENSPFNIHDLNLGYFETKYQAEQLVLKAVQSKKLEAVILNPSTIYGPGDAKKGSRKTQLKVARGEFPFYTSGGVSIISIHDVVDAAMTALTRGRNGERYILCGENITIRQLFEIIAERAGVNPPKFYLPNILVHSIGKIGDKLEAIGKKGPINSENAWTSTLYHWFSHEKASRELGLNPRSAKVAIAESVDWMREHHLLKEISS